ncbi:MAG: DUF5667 domain-containing protein [Chloroflexi bacterium]|nr:DUF5667 domain-containing protein [Chloroflexota bacterium]
MATERVQYAFAFSDDRTAELHADFAQRRAEEMARLAEAGNEERVQALASRFEAYLEKIEALAAKIKQAEPGNQVRLAALRQRIGSNEARDIAMLETAEKNAAPRFKPAIARYRVRIARAYEAALEALDGTDS